MIMPRRRHVVFFSAVYDAIVFFLSFFLKNKSRQNINLFFKAILYEVRVLISTVLRIQNDERKKEKERKSPDSLKSKKIE